MSVTPAVPRVCETFSQVPCICSPIVARANRIREDFGIAAIGLSKRHRYQLERSDVTRLIPKPGLRDSALQKFWWLKSGADTEICCMKGTSGRFLNRVPAVTREKRKTWQPRASTLEFADATAGLGKSCLHCFIFSVWMKMCRFTWKWKPAEDRMEGKC